MVAAARQALGGITDVCEGLFVHHGADGRTMICVDMAAPDQDGFQEHWITALAVAGFSPEETRASYYNELLDMEFVY